jgi:hypothetical protein
MILWVSLFAGLAVATIAFVALGVAMLRAERRARRNLYRALGLGEEAADLLIARNGDVLSELARLRMSPAASDAAAPAIDTPATEGDEPPLRPEAAPLHPQSGVRSLRSGETRLTGRSARRLPHAGRHRRL